jgi:hypothetical protein
MTHALKIPTAAEWKELEVTAKVSAPRAEDYAGWEERLRAHSAILLAEMRDQRQTQNDCQGNATANGTEARHRYCVGKMEQFSDTYAYNASEYVSSPNDVGRDSGTSMQSGVKLLTKGIPDIGVKPGLCLESEWKYGTYETKASRFVERAKGLTIEDSYVAEHGPMPPWDQMLIALSAGGTGHIGVYWAPSFVKLQNKYSCWSKNANSGGGHAVEIIAAIELSSIWYLVVWNSHGNGFKLMPRANYEAYQRNQFAPFGGYLLMPDKPVERYHNRVISGGGYFSPSKGVA